MEVNNSNGHFHKAYSFNISSSKIFYQVEIVSKKESHFTDEVKSPLFV